MNIIKKRNIDIFGTEFIDAKGNLIYPPDVKDKGSYKEWIVAKKEYETIRAKSKIKTSEGFMINVNSANPSRIKREILELPTEEQEAILTNWKILSKARGKALGLKTRAFGRGEGAKDKTAIEKLNERSIEIIALFSRLYSAEEVYKIINEQLSLKVSRSSVDKFQSQHIEEIRAAQDKYKESSDGIRLVHKRSRLEELLDLYNDRRDVYYKGKGQNDYKLLLQTLEHIRKEVEGDRVTVDANLQVKIENVINLKQEEVLRELPIKTMIISMVAGRLGINPLQLLTRLNNSYYSQFNGMKGTEAVFNSSDITYPSQIIYGVEELKALSIERTKADKKLMEYEPIEESGTDDLLSVKESLLDRLRKKKEEIKRKKLELAVIR